MNKTTDNDFKFSPYETEASLKQLKTNDLFIRTTPNSISSFTKAGTEEYEKLCTPTNNQHIKNEEEICSEKCVAIEVSEDYIKIRLKEKWIAKFPKTIFESLKNDIRIGHHLIYSIFEDNHGKRYQKFKFDTDIKPIDKKSLYELLDQL